MSLGRRCHYELQDEFGASLTITRNLSGNGELEKTSVEQNQALQEQLPCWSVYFQPKLSFRNFNLVPSRDELFSSVLQTRNTTPGHNVANWTTISQAGLCR